MKKYIVRLTDEERKLCDETVDKLVGSSQKARRARTLRQVDANGPDWIDRQVAEAAGRRAGGAVDRAALRPAAEGLRELVAALAGATGRGL